MEGVWRFDPSARLGMEAILEVLSESNDGAASPARRTVHSEIDTPSLVSATSEYV